MSRMPPTMTQTHCFLIMTCPYQLAVSGRFLPYDSGSVTHELSFKGGEYQSSGEQLRNGNWELKPEGGLFKREWFKGHFIDLTRLPSALGLCRFWDLAASEQVRGNDPDFTAGVLLGCDRDGVFNIIDVVRARATPLSVQRLTRSSWPGPSSSPDRARRRLASRPRRCRSSRTPSAPTPRGSWGRASGSRVSPTSPTSDPVRTRPPRASGPRALRPTTRPPRPTPPVWSPNVAWGSPAPATSRCGARPAPWTVGTFFGRFHIDPATGPAGGPRDGPRAVAAREEARGLAAPRVQGQAPVPEAAMDWCQWECELTED